MELHVGNMMTQQGVIYPAEPLLIVDRQYRRKKSQKAETPTFSVQSTKRDITVSVFRRQSPNYEGALKTNAPTKPEAQPCPQRSQKFEFVNATQESKIPHVKKAGAARRKSNNSEPEATSTTVSDSSAKSTPTDEPWVQRSSPLRLGGIVPSSSARFYGYAGSHIKSNAKDLLDYYTVGIARAFYPLQDIIHFDLNPVKAAWMPAAYDDESLLNTILLCSETHWKYVFRKTSIDHNNPYYRHAITNVNKRLAAGEVCDAVIGAVGCLVLIEHYLANLDSSAMHRSGLVEMLRVRGGLQTVRKPLQMKIYRADIIPAVDRLVPPKLPRLRPTLPSLHALVFHNADPNKEFADSLVATGMSLYVTDIMLAMNALSRSLQYSIEHDLTVPSRAFDEDTMGIQHDLLLVPTYDASDVDLACRSAALIYMKSLTREDPCNFEAITDPLVKAIKKTSINSQNVRLLFWSSFMGAMSAQRIEKCIWFREQLVILCEHIGIIEWSHAETILQGISWITKIHGQAGKHVWDVINNTPP